MARDKEPAASPNALVPVQDLFPVLSTNISELREIAQENLAGAPVSMFSLERIRVPAGGGLSWRVVSEDGTEDELREVEGIIVAQFRQRAFWKDPLAVTGGGTPPDCLSTDCEIGRGDNGSGDGDHSCASCPHSQWGTKVVEGRNTRGQACGERRMFLLLRKGRDQAIFPSLVILPPGSFKNIGAWMFALLSQNTRFYSVIAKFTLEKKEADAGATFSAAKLTTVGRVPPDMIPVVKAYGDAMAKTFGAEVMAAARADHGDT